MCSGPTSLHHTTRSRRMDGGGGVFILPVSKSQPSSCNIVPATSYPLSPTGVSDPPALSPLHPPGFPPWVRSRWPGPQQYVWLLLSTSRYTPGLDSLTHIHTHTHSHMRANTMHFYSISHCDPSPLKPIYGWVVIGAGRHL